jgi:SAM-dependent methyltransferase
MTAALPLRAKAPPFAPPRHVADRSDCYFYHTIELPGEGTIEGSWDLRDDVDNYLGHVDLSGKRVLELGTASGFLCFEMEKRGADVVGYDLSDKYSWDLVPYAAAMEQIKAMDHKGHIRQLNNSWWLGHRLNQSRARVVYGSIYDVPDSIGPVDVATFGCILLHLQNPFLALAQAARLVRETIIVTEHDAHWHERPAFLGPAGGGKLRRWRRFFLKKVHQWLGDPGWWRREEIAAAMDELPLMMFLPNPHTLVPLETWWYMRPNALRHMLGVLGFPNTTLTHHIAKFNGTPQRMFTIVGRRDPGGKPELRVASE